MRRTTAILLTLLFAAFVESAAAQQLITAISVEGNSRIDDSTVLLEVTSEVGRPLDTNAVDNDVKAIYRTGFFEQVVVKRRPAGNGVALVFAVEEKPAIREIKVEGTDEVSTDTFLEKLNIGSRRFLDRKKIAAGIAEVKKYYQSKGLYGTEVDYRVSPVKQNQVDVTFNVNEGTKKVIREVVFEGNKTVDPDDLDELINTSHYKWWSSWITGSGVVKQEDLDNDVRELTKHYLNNGYVDVKVAEPTVEEREEGLRVTFRISEGEVFQFGRISAAGALLDNSETKTLEGIESKTGETFSVEKLRKDTFTVSEKFTDIGYAFANVDPLTNIDRTKKQVAVNFMIDKGNLITVNRINLTGNQKTADNVIRRTLKINERELFSSSKIRRSQELLQRLGYFEEVTITPEPALNENEVDLAVAVREGMTGSFSAGAGISSDEGFIVSSQISENNLFGSGNSVGLNVNLGSERENFILSFNNPRVNDTHWSFGADLLKTMREFDDFDRDQAGGSLSVGYPLWFLGPEALDDVRFSLGYELLAIDISDVDADAPELVRQEEGESTSSSVIPQLVRNTIDNPLDPKKGSRQVAKFEIAGLGGDEEFWLTTLANTWYYPLWQSPIGTFVFSQRTVFGYGESFNDEPFPLFRRFFPGGINSVRGYESREMGPKDENGGEYGGSKQLVGNFELIFPLFEKIGLNGVVFYDIGEAFDDEESIDVAELRAAVGWGIRWRSPIAPIRLEVGYPLDAEGDDDPSVVNFSFGAPM